MKRSLSLLAVILTWKELWEKEAGFKTQILQAYFSTSNSLFKADKLIMQIYKIFSWSIILRKMEL